MSWKDCVFGAYENYVMGSSLGRFCLAAKGSSALFYILFRVL